MRQLQAVGYESVETRLLGPWAVGVLGLWSGPAPLVVTLIRVEAVIRWTSFIYSGRRGKEIHSTNIQ